MEEGAVDIEAVQSRHDAARKMVNALCKPRGTEGAKEWVMRIPAEPEYDPDLVIGASVSDIPRLIRELQWYRDRDRVAEGGRYVR